MRCARIDGFTARGYDEGELVSLLESRGQAEIAGDPDRYSRVSGFKARLVGDTVESDGATSGVVLLEVLAVGGSVGGQAVHELLRGVLASEAAAGLPGRSLETRPVEWDTED